MVSDEEDMHRLKELLKTRLPFLPPSGYNCFATDHEGVKWYKAYNYLEGTLTIYDPPLLYFASQLELGEVYEEPYLALEYSLKDDTLIRTYPGIYRISLESVEDVTIPIGTFKDCLKIYQSYTESYENETKVVIYHFTIWCAPNVGWIKSDYWDSKDGKTIYAGSYEVIHATVDGVRYGYNCPAALALGADSNDLDILRKFRDEVLSKTSVGQEMIELYYQLSPAIVKAMREDKKFKVAVQEMIEEILPLLRKTIE